jgi:hypothetical protein
MVPSFLLELKQILDIILGISSMDLKASIAYITLILGRRHPGSTGCLGNLFTLGSGRRQLLFESASVGGFHIVK